ncbi:MAG TPA: tetratricopeptide repeat protein, partial [Stellaceae bacterium]|nr:tetratricopeptide repeat protein [Stellaceae bacterium]
MEEAAVPSSTHIALPHRYRIAWWISKRAVLFYGFAALAFPVPAHAQRVETQGAQSPAITAGRDATVSYIGLSPEQVQDLIKAARVGDDADKIADLSGKLGVLRGAAVTILGIVGQPDVPLERLPQKLAEVAEQFKQATARLAGLDPQDPITRDLVERAEAAIKVGNLEEADQLVSQAEQAEIAAAHQAQQLAQQAQAAADHRLLRAAADRGVRGDIAMTRLHYLNAAQHFQEAADLVPIGHPDDKGRFLVAKADALQRQGDERGDNPSLEKAIAAYHAGLVEYTRDRAPLDWAATQHNLGTALDVLGGRESGTARLEEAVTAFRAALLEYTRERVPLDWAMTQNGLGNALATLGERESGTGRLEEAIAAYRAALQERIRERVPLDWAATQNNLGIALKRLGERESGTARLEEAVAAYRGALQERTRERVPLDWAITQNNLGVALWKLGERESGTTRLEEAVAAYRAALEEQTRERVPLQWAMTQNNLGGALTRLGEREGGTVRLEEAVAA